MDLYAENILEHSKHPRHKLPIVYPPKHGARKRAQPSIVHSESNPACGDAITLELVIEKGKIAQSGWDGSGCALSQAGISMLLENIAGKKVQDATALSPKIMRDLLGVPLTTRRLQCAFLPLLTIRNALRKRQEEQPLTWAELLEEDTAA